MKIGGIVKVAGKAVEFAKNHPEVVGVGMKLAGDAVKKSGTKKDDGEEKIFLLQKKIELLQIKITSLEEKVEIYRKWLCAGVTVSIIALIVAIVGICL